jgi:hypothetical protein
MTTYRFSDVEIDEVSSNSESGFEVETCSTNHSSDFDDVPDEEFLQPAPSSFYSESRQQDIFTQKG